MLEPTMITAQAMTRTQKKEGHDDLLRPWVRGKVWGAILLQFYACCELLVDYVALYD